MVDPETRGCTWLQQHWKHRPLPLRANSQKHIYFNFTFSLLCLQNCVTKQEKKQARHRDDSKFMIHQFTTQWLMVSHLMFSASKKQMTDNEANKKMLLLVNLFESELHTWIKAFNYCRQALETWSMKNILKDTKVALKNDSHTNVLWLNIEVRLTSTVTNWNTM